MRRLPALVLIALSLSGALAVGGVLAASITGTGKADVLRGTQKADRLDGRAGNDRLYGLGGADTLLGGPGNDTLVGGPGSDSYRCGPGRDTIVGEAGEKARADCEVVRGIAAPSPPKPPAPAPPPPPPPAPKPPPGPATLISFAVCPASGTTTERGQFVCTSSSAGGTITGAKRIYCTASFTNPVGSPVSIAFLYDGKEFFEPPSNTTDGTAETYLAWAWYEYPDGFPAGSWGCRAKVDGKVVGELAFTTAR